MTGATAGEHVNLSFVGLGGFARRYHLPAVEADPDVTVVTICDPAPAPETRAFAGRAGAALVEGIEDLPAPTGRAGAIVSTPHTLHAGHTARLIALGYNVLVDKPFVMHLDEARTLAASADAKGLVHGVAFNRRFDRSCQRAREIIDAGGIGAVRFVQTVQLGYERAGWFLRPELGGGGPYTGRGTHMADLVPWLLGRAPTRVRSRVRGGSAERSDEGGFIELQFDALECQMACIEEGWHMWDEVRVFGDDGLIEMRRPLTEPLGWSLEWSHGRGAFVERIAADPHPGDATRDFLAAVRAEHGVGCSFHDAATSVAIIEAAFRSAAGDGDWVGLTG